MNLGITNAKIVGFISTFFLLLLSYVLLFFNTQKLAEQSVTVEHTNKVINNLEYLVSQIKEIEYNYHGFVATKLDIFEGNYLMSVKRTDSLFRLIKGLTKDTDLQQRRLDTIRTILDQKVATMSNGIALLNNSNNIKQAQGSLYKLEYLNNNRTEIRRQIRIMQHMEEAFLEMRTEILNKSSGTIKWINLASLALAFLLAITSYITYRRENIAGMQANKKSELYKKQLEDKLNDLAEANKEIRQLRNIEKFASTGRIARTIAHEVRNPLTNINLASEQLKESVPETEETQMLLDMVKRNSLRINHLISNLLNATKFSELIYEATSINDLIDSALELADDRINLKHVDIKKSYASNICDITVDEEKMKVAFLNIIVNAIEAMKNEQGVLKITTKTEGSKCKVIFEDNGIGMSEETLSKLFEPFFTNKEGGNGLGLTNTQNIILNHKGKIEVESVEGKGTTFILLLDMS